MVRVPLATAADLPEAMQKTWERLSARSTLPDGGPIHFYRLLANDPDIMRGQLALGNAAWSRCGLDDRGRELVILRTVSHRRVRYPWHQHVRAGRAAGLSDDEINAIRDPAKWEIFSPLEQAVLAYVDAMVKDMHASDETWAALKSFLEPPAIVGLTSLIAMYSSVAMIMSTLELEPETPFVGWEL